MAITYPLITVSTRNQVDKSRAAAGFFGQWQTAKEIWSTEGVGGFYSGIDSAIFGNAVTNGVYYFWYEGVKLGIAVSKERAGLASNTLSTPEAMLAGALAGAATAIITNPIWVVMTRTIARRSEMSKLGGTQPASGTGLSTFSVAADVFQKDGVAGFFTGLVPALILVINPIIQYSAFERMKQRLESFRGARQTSSPLLTDLDFFCLGALSKLIATGITYPYIVIKSRMQLRQGPDDETRYSSVWDAFSKIFRVEGLGGFYKGLESKLLQSIMTAALLFFSKEIIFRYTLNLITFLRGLRASRKVKMN
ncbi:mitochondrial carrier [Gonapodya prolifera JEL478]|uniref:Mitochondrial carrier n=1 Tax=Gonapodya prolifera (strain JEL478) TaxID=1344416 RepID=A0A139ACY5_GONPJ|nr:mitochondrial carrier [Gonapodya prolifera JEL478]|eukprot:KXS14273.1 mitochondrial carrier [Gonapodya prolifera JEL478]